MIPLIVGLWGSAWASGYARLDFEQGIEARVGVFAPVSRTTAIAPVLRGSGRQAELDLGLSTELGALHLSGWMAGGMRYDATVPFFGPGLAFAIEIPPLPLYFESTTEYRIFRPFGGTADELLKRDLVLFTLRYRLSAGAQFEPRWRNPGGLQSNHIGPRVNIGFQRGDAIGLFAGWDTLGTGVLVRATLLLRF